MLTGRKRRLEAAERYVRELVEGGAPASLILITICKLIEAEDSEAIAGITATDAGRAGFERAVFPALPPNFSAAVTSVKLKEPFTGSCTKAVMTGRTVTCTDIAADKEFDAGWRSLCLESGVKSLQSVPVFAADGHSFATFVLCYREPSAENRFDSELMTAGARLAALVLDPSPRTRVDPAEVAIQAAE